MCLLIRVKGLLGKRDWGIRDAEGASTRGVFILYSICWLVRKKELFFGVTLGARKCLTELEESSFISIFMKSVSPCSYFVKMAKMDIWVFLPPMVVEEVIFSVLSACPPVCVSLFAFTLGHKVNCTTEMKTP